VGEGHKREEAEAALRIGGGVLKEARPSPRTTEKGGGGGWMVEVARACRHVTH